MSSMSVAIGILLTNQQKFKPSKVRTYGVTAESSTPPGATTKVRLSTK